MGVFIVLFLVWFAAPFAELVVIIVLSEKNRQYKKKIEDLEQTLRYRQAQRQQPVAPAIYPEPAPARAVPVAPAAYPEPAPARTVPVAPAAYPGSASAPPVAVGAANGQVSAERVYGVPGSGRIGGGRQMPAAAAGCPEKPASHASAMGTLALIIGIVLVVLAGLVFATTTWRILPDFCKVLLIGFFGLTLFGASFVAEKKLHIHKTGNGLYVLGSIFLFLTVLAACYFRFFGSAFVLDGGNRFLVLWLGSLVTVGIWFLGLRRFYDRVFTQACLCGSTVSMMFLAAYFVLDWREFSSVMMVYAFFLLLAQWLLSRIRNRAQGSFFSDAEQGDSKAGTEEGGLGDGRKKAGATWGETGEMLAQELARFVPVHFWVFAVLCAEQGIAELLYKERSVLTLAALLSAVAGTGVMYIRKKSGFAQCMFALSLQYFLHYVLLGWLFTGKSDGIYAFVLAEAVSAVWFLLADRIRIGGSERSGVAGIVCSAAVCVDGLVPVLWMHFADMAGIATTREYLTASAAVVLSVLVLHVWSRRFAFLKNLSYIVCLELTVTAYHLVLSVTDACPGYPVFALSYLCILLLWSFWRQEDCLPAVVVICLLTRIDFPLSAAPVLLSAVLAVAGAGRKRQVPGQKWLLCFLYVFSALGFYGGLWTESGLVLLYLLMSVSVFVLFYRGKWLWLSGVPAVAVLPVPLVLAVRCGITGDKLYALVAGTLLATGAAARCMVPIIRKREEDGGFQIDFCHLLSAAVIIPMAFLADRYWRFAYVLLLGLYCIQYVTVKGVEACAAVRRTAVTAAVFCVLSAFWLQPFILWPQVIELEIGLLAGVVFIWSLVFIWGKSKTLRDVQIVGYAFCLVILALDGIFTGRAEDALILEGICLAILIWAKIKSDARWQYLSAVVMFGFAAGDFYTDSCLRLWGVGLLLFTFWLSYWVFYGGTYAGWCLHFISSALMLPVPLVLHSGYGVTGDWLYGLTAGSLLVTGAAARLTAPVVKAEREEGGQTRWRIDFYHIVCAVPLLIMTVQADRYWRFAYILLLGLYCIQYITVKEFDGFEKVRQAARTGAAACLCAAFWLQPFLVWPEIVELEISLVPAALFLWYLGHVWGNSKTLQNIRTAGCVLILGVLSADGIRTGRVEDALMLGGLCLFVFVWALVKSSVRWVRISGALLVAEALYMTKDFWFSLSWWVYLLAAGIGLLVFAAVSEKKKREGD